MAEVDAVTVRVAQGELRGRKAVAAWGAPYYAFHGIPYAAPPVGPLRFKPPQPASAWTGTRDATKEGSVAAQFNPVTGVFEGEEDCLFINVYTPKLRSEGSGSLLPVMFMVHGGWLMCMSGNEESFGPDFLLQHGVLMVSFNYRLGVLGFLSTGDSVVPGNMGFKDQVAALRWVRDNIASFGGDPDNVTIFGASAGGWSCHALTLSPLAKGLFLRAIAQSGVTGGDGVVTELVRDRSFQLAAHLGFQTNDSTQLLEFLMRQPAKLLQESAIHARSDEDAARGVFVPFVGTIEPEDAEGGAFLSRSPLDIMTSGDLQHVPFITGVCAYEGTVFVAATLLDPKMVSSYRVNPRLLVPTNLPCSENDKDSVADQIRRFYFGDREISADTTKELCLLLGDLMFNYAAVRAARYHSCESPAPVYFYIFDISRETPQAVRLLEETSSFAKNIGAAGHGADTGYVFHSTLCEMPAPDKNSVDGKLIYKITRLWTNFAKTGCPTDPELDVSWPTFTTEDSAYLLIDAKGLSVLHRPFEERITFWDALYSRYGC